MGLGCLLVLTMTHKTRFVEPSLLIAVGAEPMAPIVVSRVSETRRDMIS
jgi:hypothetical protein